jgi:hypothetical protein
MAGDGFAVGLETGLRGGHRPLRRGPGKAASIAPVLQKILVWKDDALRDVLDLCAIRSARLPITEVGQRFILWDAECERCGAPTVPSEWDRREQHGRFLTEQSPLINGRTRNEGHQQSDRRQPPPTSADVLNQVRYADEMVIVYNNNKVFVTIIPLSDAAILMSARDDVDKFVNGN